MKRQEYEYTEGSILLCLNILNSKTSKDKEKEKFIAKTILKLPGDVREKVLKNRVLFIYSSCPGTSGVISFKRLPNKFECPIITLNFENIKNGREMDIIAHEIAHFFLEDYKNKEKSTIEKERAADDLIEEWGFRRSYSEENLQKYFGE